MDIINVMSDYVWCVPLIKFNERCLHTMIMVGITVPFVNRVVCLAATELFSLNLFFELCLLHRTSYDSQAPPSVVYFIKQTHLLLQ